MIDFVHCLSAPNCAQKYRTPCGTNVTQLIHNVLGYAFNSHQSSTIVALLNKINKLNMTITPPDTCGPCMPGLVDSSKLNGKTGNEDIVDQLLWGWIPGNGECIQDDGWDMSAGNCLFEYFSQSIDIPPFP